MNLNRYNSWAVVTAECSKESKAFSIIKELQDKDFKVVAIDENLNPIDGVEVYESLKDVPNNIDVVTIVEKYTMIESIFDEMELLDIRNLWFEEGSFNAAILKKAKELKLNIEHESDLCRELNDL
ncbi:CoA-binding protein [Metaclostridioides mangenotii]|jgi:predicted CoA-binding protein|uniref:CoA-binding protein n=1 Tax=Metaclostridioides mangenotii TaxID=1540 RepID=A0ABS4E8F4_9FIRM|nr:CoA-binding protein [Clostridioides mangenotii]MBP1854230.1 putative CoA-binding protein [Clostridioides mangenotii]